MKLPLSGLAAAVLVAGLAASAPLAQGSEPLDQPYPGTVTLSVDLTDAGRKIFRVREVIPVRPGPFALHYPKWVPGEHGPSGPIDGVSGVVITAGGRRLPWRRDPVDLFTLRLDVPADANALEINFQFLSPAGGANFGASASVTNRLLVMAWNQVVFYPANYVARQVTIQPEAILPAGWGYATALEKEGEAGGRVRFKPVDLENFVDSPLIAGRNFKRVDLAPGVTPPVYLNVVADRPENLTCTDEQLTRLRALVTQAHALFGARHYSHYDFLFTLSDGTGHFGLEHHQSSDDRLAAEYFTDPELHLRGVTLLPHEYVHSWNGKFRRPAGLATPNFNVPMKGGLLWVYEGLTEYLGNVLTVRSGLWTAEQYRQNLAIVAARMGNVTGRAWRPLQDTADQASILYNSPGAWQNWRRGVDFYDEGELLWLEVDTTIRELSQGARSVDDFCRAFFGQGDTRPAVVTYTFEDVVSVLQQVQPHDWASWLRTRLDSTEPAAPLGGLARGGWKLAFTDKPTDLFKAGEKTWKITDLMDSLGVIIDAGDSSGTLADVRWQGPGFEAGLAPGMKVIAVNGDKFTPDILKDAIKAARNDTAPLELLVQSGDTFRTVRVDYHGGLRYPQLERIADAPDRIADIAQPRP